MTDGYVERRKSYVAEIRNSFETPEKTANLNDMPETTESSFVFVKVRFFIAAFLLVVFLFAKQSDIEIYGYCAEEIVDILCENHYDTILQKDVLQ